MNDRVVSVKNLRFTEEEQYVIDNKYGEIKSYYEQMGIDEVTAVMQASYTRLLEAQAALSAK